MAPTAFNSVLLPEPEGPSRPTTSLDETVNVMSRRASTRVSPSPKCLHKPLSSTRGRDVWLACLASSRKRARGVDAQGGTYAEHAGQQADDDNHAKQHGDIRGQHLDPAGEPS